MTVRDLLIPCANYNAVVKILVPCLDYYNVLNEDHFDLDYVIEHFGNMTVCTFRFDFFRYTDRISGIVKEIETIRIYIDPTLPLNRGVDNG